ncbi:putative serine threonine protein kinase protein [Neofusicoccum parvum UCRNP2]|uniref:Putative serine threonine protein kinase protein n=1 Tax=Botryosphaeria parva (strain UCR-NP2) TaxID=1287680 RepID=R1G971_BOTPV|nr:putative serine threonine protein kinase protein [Neofusicoccum parvum UCRNP2]
MDSRYEDIDELFEVRIASLIDPKVIDDRRKEYKTMYEKLKRIGDGSEGEVFKMLHQETRQIVAGRDYILRLVDGEWYPCTPKDDYQMLVMEYCELGTFMTWLTQQCAQDRTGTWRAPHEGQLRHFYIQMVKAIAFLHCGWGTYAFDHDTGRVPGHKPLLHRDIKPENILLCPAPDGTLDSLPTLKLSDFGGAWQCAVPEPPQGQSLYFFTDGYIAPEFLQPPLTRDEANEACDVFAVGATMHCAIFGHNPFKELRRGQGQRSTFTYRRRAIDHARHRGADPFSPDFAARLDDALAESPLTRRTAHQILTQLQPAHAQHMAAYERWWHAEEVPYQARLAAEEQLRRERTAGACSVEAAPAQDCMCDDAAACGAIADDAQYLRADRHAWWHERQVERHREI